MGGFVEISFGIPTFRLGARAELRHAMPLEPENPATQRPETDPCSAESVGVRGRDGKPLHERLMPRPWPRTFLQKQV